MSTRRRSWTIACHKDVVAATPAVIASVQENLPRGFPQRMLDAILKGLSKSAKQLEAMPAA